MRNISFSLTTHQVRARSKTVTRRLGWLFLKKRDLLCAVVKVRGLKAGEKVERIAVLQVEDVCHEPLDRMIREPAYGRAECIREGFAPPSIHAEPGAFVEMFCRTHPGCTPSSTVTRIEFSYVKPPQG